MSYSLTDAVEWEPCAPMFVETDGGFALTDAAREIVELLDPPKPTVLERMALLREQARVLAVELAAAAGPMETHDLLDSVEALHQTTKMLSSGEQAVVAELDRRGTYETYGATSTADLLRAHLRVRPADAKRRVQRARACAGRMSLDGQVLPPLRPQVAAAQAAGAISADHASVIDSVLTRLPVALPVDTVDAVEAALVELAGKVDPTDVAAAGRQAVDRFDPDGPEPRDQQQRRRRGITLSQRDDGAGNLRGDLTADLLAKLQTVLSPLAAPRPDDGNGPDTRTPAQRLHDALEELCDRFLRSGTLPDSGGVPATVCVTIPLTHLEHRTGRVHTSHGGDLSVPQLLHLATDAEIIPVVLNDAGGILTYGRSKRFATAAQTKALRARDHGCSFPGCTRPPEWCQRHHIQEWTRDHGNTDIDQLTLLCTHHHHNFHTWGWQVTMIDGVPWWTPPAHLDPERKPVQNTAHRPVITANDWPAAAR